MVSGNSALFLMNLNNKSKVFAGLAVFLGLSAFAGNEWIFSYHPASVKYSIYSGTLGEPEAPLKKRKSVSFEVSGVAAKEMFDSMGPDVKAACPANDGERVREKNGGAVRCYMTGKANYQCYFGIDLSSGRAIPGDIC